MFTCNNLFSSALDLCKNCIKLKGLGSFNSLISGDLKIKNFGSLPLRCLDQQRAGLINLELTQFSILPWPLYQKGKMLFQPMNKQRVKCDPSWSTSEGRPKFSLKKSEVSSNNHELIHQISLCKAEFCANQQVLEQPQNLLFEVTS